MKQSLCDALFRYDAMAGAIAHLEDDDLRRAESDRVAYGSEYLDVEDGKALYNPLQRIRFLAEVCGFPFAESWAAVGEEYRAVGGGEGRARCSAPEQAQKLRAAFGDIFTALIFARFLAKEERQPQARAYWGRVVRALKQGSARAAAGAEARI